MKIDTIKITIEGYRAEAYGNLIRAALEQGANGFPLSTARNLAENTHVELLTQTSSPEMVGGI